LGVFGFAEGAGASDEASVGARAGSGAGTAGTAVVALGAVVDPSLLAELGGGLSGALRFFQMAVPTTAIPSAISGKKAFDRVPCRVGTELGASPSAAAESVPVSSAGTVDVGVGSLARTDGVTFE
jgi:hypothetical protein